MGNSHSNTEFYVGYSEFYILNSDFFFLNSKPIRL
jgi:hypothetical protein